MDSTDRQGTSAAYGAAVEIIDDPVKGTPIPGATWAAVAREAAIERVSGQWVNGVNVGLSPSFPLDGLCPTCREPFDNVETSMPAPPSLRSTSGKITPPKIKGPYFTPCGHDAASVYGGRVDA